MPEIPLYRKLQQTLKVDILSGCYREGDLLPSENSLKETWQVTRHTVRRALLELEKEGYIERRQGKGSVVIPRKQRTLGLLSVKGFSQVVGEAKKVVKTIMIEQPVIMNFPAVFFYPVSQREREAGCIYFKRTRWVDEEPVMLESTYISNIGMANFIQTPFINGSLFETLNKVYQVEITRVEQDLRAVSAGEEAIYWLKIRKGTPLLQILLKFHTNREHVFVYSSLLCNTEKYSIGNNV